jgi:orotidine-5'-phosphate decarboxylase
MKDFENLEIDQGEPGHRGRRLYVVVGENLSRLAAEYRGVHGYGAFGAVVGVNAEASASAQNEAGASTQNEAGAAAIREKLPGLFFLVPGYGAQGGAAEDAAALLVNGNGAVVNASRSILKAWMAAAGETGSAVEHADNSFAAEAARQAVTGMRDAIQAAVKADKR